MPSEPLAPRSTDQWRTFGQSYLPGLIGIEFGDVARGRVTSRLAIRTERLAPNGYPHAATVVAGRHLVRLRHPGQPPGRCQRLHDGRAEGKLP
jgi:hypothetical protein